MTIQRHELTPGTIAITKNGKIVLITDVKSQNVKYPIIYTSKIDARGYKGNENDFQTILGQVSLSNFTDNKPDKVVGYDEDFIVPAELKGIKIGDTIMIRSRKGTEAVEYLGYNPRCPKNCVSIRMKGKDYKGPLSIVVNATKR